MFCLFFSSCSNKKDVVTRICSEMMKRAVFWGEGNIIGICIVSYIYLMDFKYGSRNWVPQKGLQRKKIKNFLQYGIWEYP